jgi:phosphatidylinositol-3-phosphatase
VVSAARSPRPAPPALTRAVVIATIAVVASACSAPATAGSPPNSPAAPGASSRDAPGPTRAGRAPLVLIVLENHEASAIVGSSDASYLNDSLIPNGRLFTHYTAVAHPSLPNYLAMTSGSTQGKVGTDAVSAGEIHSRNLFGQLSDAGIHWRAYEETMPSACYTPYSAGPAPGQYALKHDPAMTYADVAGSAARCRHVMPLARLDTSHLPHFSFVTPNLCDDMHSCSVSTGDAWLRVHVPPLLAAGAIVVVTFDEGSTDTGGGGDVALVEAGPGIPRGSVDRTAFDHYSLLAGIEDRFGLVRLGAARTARPLPL